MTIMFRQPPGVDTAEGSLAWVRFTVMFCEAAIKTAHSYDALKGYAEELKYFLKNDIIRGASDPKLFGKVIGKVSETRKVYPGSALLR